MLNRGRPLSAKHTEVLFALYWQRDRWVTPMYIGGRDGSHHTGTLLRLRVWGLVERDKTCRLTGHTGDCRCKGACRYKLTDHGVIVAFQTDYYKRRPKPEKENRSHAQDPRPQARARKR